MEGEGGDDFGEKDPRAVVAGDQAGVFADDAEAGLFGEGAFEEGAGVDVAFVLVFGGQVVEEGFELLEFFGDNFVVVATEGVAGDTAVLRGKWGLGAIVVHGDAYNTLGAGEQQAEVATLGDFFHVAHGALVVVCEPSVEGV